MSPGTMLRAIDAEQVPAIRAGLLVLVLGSFVMMSSLYLLSPAIDGLVMIDGPSISRPAESSASGVRRVAPAPPPLTPAQKFVARQTAVRVAVGEIGVRESGINDGTRIRNYRRSVTGPGEKAWAPEPWCADFVSWAWKRAGVPIGFSGNGSDYVPELVAWAGLTRRWHWARDGYRPQPGDLVVFKSQADTRGHIGIVAGVGNGRITTVEGNFSDQVKRQSHKVWSPIITGFISPV